MRILEYPLVEEGALSGTDSFIVETENGTKRVSIDELKNNLDISATFPIGYVYMSFENTSPAEMFGGSWLQLENVFLRAANNLDTGGSDTVTLTVAQMPSHKHYLNKSYYAGGGRTDWGLVGAGASGGYVIIDGGNRSDVLTGGTGSTQAHSNLPAYQNVYAWRRIS